MKYSSTLLKHFISIDDDPENIADNLILKTCEIEEIIARKIPQDVIIGYVKSCTKHPDADRLSVCVVDCGDKGEHTICCGGVNVKEGIYVATAILGCYLPAIDLTIGARKLKGIDSNGMICSKEELGIKEDLDMHSIWDLQQDFDDVSDADIGTPLVQKYGWLESRVFDVDNKGLTHRPDLTGHWGAAVELNTIYTTTENLKEGNNKIAFHKIKEYFETFTHTHILQTLEESNDIASHIVSETDGLNTYILLEINDVEIKPSSFLTRLAMLDIDQQPRNNWVDFSNLFMHITGQPVHFFDADKIQGDVIVRNAKEGEKFTDLFETEHILKSTDLVITDKEKILALAGVVGGMHSGVTDATKNILVEIANFDPVAVRKTGTRLGLRTDAELRFEKNINPVYSLYALLFFLDLMKYYQKDLGTFELKGNSFYVADGVREMISSPKFIDIDYTKIAPYIFGDTKAGFEQTSKDILSGLGFVAEDTRVGVPMRRGPGDMNIAEDLIEEVSRIYGYNNIDPLPIKSDLQNMEYTPEVEITRHIEDILVRNLGFDQVETYPWISAKQAAQFGVDTNILYQLQNPVNPELPYLRNFMAYGLLAHATKNSKFFDEFALFDIGKTRTKTDDKKTGVYASDFVSERLSLGTLIYSKDQKDWKKDTILQMKGHLEQIFQELGDISYEIQQTEYSFFHPKKQGKIIVKGKEVGGVGTLHPVLLKANKLPETAGVTYAWVVLSTILDVLDIKQQSVSYETLQDQIVYRDLCFVVNKDQTYDALFENINNIPQIQDVEIFDLYQGENIGKDKKSVAFKMKIVGNNMTTEDINKIMDQAIKVGESVGAELRK